MKKFIFVFVLLSFVMNSCRRQENALVSVAKENLPDLLEREMASYMGTQGSPDIKDIMVIFQCDSMCVLQAKASGKTAEGEQVDETIRYYLIKDMFVSIAQGRLTYCHAVKGAPYLDESGIKEFTKTTTEHSHEVYSYFLATGQPVSLFGN